MRTLLLGLFVLAFAAYHAARAANSTYTVSPMVFIAPPFANTKLILTSSNLTTDPAAGRFYLIVDTTFSSPQGVGVLPRATLTGLIAWQQPGLVLFSFSDDTAASCQQAGISSPPLCPYLQTLVNGPFYYGAYPSTGATVAVSLEANAASPGGSNSNFLGASIPLTFVCSGTCEAFGTSLPPAVLPANASFTNVTINTLQVTGTAILNALQVLSNAVFNTSARVLCYFAVLPFVPTNSVCGDFTATRVFVGDAEVITGPPLLIGRQTRVLTSGQFMQFTDFIGTYDISSATTAPTLYGDILRTDVYNTLSTTRSLSTTASKTGIIRLYGPISSTGTIAGFLSQIEFRANWTGSLSRISVVNPSVIVTAGASGVISSWHPYPSFSAPTGTVNATDASNFRCGGNMRGVTKNRCGSSVEQTGGTNNANWHMDCDNSNDGCSLMAGTLFDTKWSRCRAGAWCPGTGQDIFTDSGYICAGTGCSSVTTAAIGVYQAGVQVIDTLACTGLTCTKSSGSYTVAIPSTFTSPGSVTSTTNTNIGTAITGAGTKPSFVFGSGANCASSATGTLDGTNQMMYLSFTTGTGSCGLNANIAVLTFGATAGVTTRWNCAVNAAQGAVSFWVDSTATTFSIRSSGTAALSPSTLYAFAIGPCAGY